MIYDKYTMYPAQCPLQPSLEQLEVRRKWNCTEELQGPFQRQPWYFEMFWYIEEELLAAGKREQFALMIQTMINIPP